MKYLSASLVLGFSAILSGCTDIGAGRPLIVRKDGTPEYPKGSASEKHVGLYKSLYIAEQAVLPKAQGTPPTQEQLIAFREAGFDLVQQSCQFYISAKTRQQRWVNTWRDSFGPVTALVTGAIPLIGTGGSVDKNVVQALSLTTTAANSAFDIYEQRFLFGTKNVEGVRNLVLDALSAHAKASAKTDAGKLTYGKVILRITEHQIICSPSAISELVTASINTATPTSQPAANSTSLRTTVTAASNAPAEQTVTTSEASTPSSTASGQGDAGSSA